MRWLLGGVTGLLLGIVTWAHLQNPEHRHLDAAARAESGMAFIGLSEGVTAYRLEGPPNAPLVVLVHGFSVPSHLWSSTASALHAAGLRTLRYDLYGRGWSDRPEGPYTLERFTRQLQELLTALEVSSPVHLVGLSMGGLIATATAATHPEQVDRLALIAPFNTSVRLRPLEIPGVGEVLAALAYFPRQSRLLAENFADPAHLEDYAPGFLEQLQFRGFRRAILSTLRHLIVVDPLPTYQTLGQQHRPVAVIWGDADRVVPHTQAPRVISALGPNARLITIPGAGHLPQADRPAPVFAALIEQLTAPAQP